MLARSLVLAFALLAVAASAGAQSYRPPLDASTLRTAAVDVIRACAVEARRDCTGAPDVLVCLLVKPVRSGACGDALRDGSVLFDALDYCAEDIDHFCGYVAPGRGRVMTCLADHHDLISDDCYLSLAQGAADYREIAGGESGFRESD